MNTVQATVYGAKLLLSLLLGQVPKIDLKSTINERLDISASARPVLGEAVKLGILCIGNGGHRLEVGQGGIPLTSIVDHMANHAAAYSPMPFCIRPVDNDLDLNGRSKYALRREETHNNINYYVYYGLRIKIGPDDAIPSMKKITTENGQTLETPFVPTTADLYPEPVILPNTGAVTTTDVRLAASAILSIKLSENDVAEYINVAKVLYAGDERYAIMSEFLLCTAADRQISVNSTAGQVNFMEAIGTQVYSFSADYKALAYNSQELTLDFDIGNQVPLLGTASIPTLETIGGTVTPPTNNG